MLKIIEFRKAYSQGLTPIINIKRRPKRIKMMFFYARVVSSEEIRSVTSDTTTAGVLLLTWINVKNSTNNISNYIHYKVWDQIINLVLNFKNAAIKVCEWISNFISCFTGHVITYPSYG